MLLSVGIVYDHQITQHMHCIMLLCFLQFPADLVTFTEEIPNGKLCTVCNPNVEWPHVALFCYNKSEKELCYMKWLIVDRLARVMLISLWNVWSWFYFTKRFIRTNRRLQETKILGLLWNCYSIISKRLGSKVWMQVFLREIL